MIKPALNTILTRGFVTVLLVLHSSIWTRLLAPEGRGLYAKLQAGQNFLALFLGFGLSAGIVYYCSSKKASREQLWTLSVLTTTFGSVLTALIIMVGRIWPELDIIFPDRYESIFFSLYFWSFFVLTQLQLSMNSFLSAEHQFANLNRIEILTTSLRLVAVVFAYLFFHDRLTLQILFGLDLLAHILRTVFFARYFRRLNISLRLVRLTWRQAAPVLTYSVALYFLGVIQFVYQRIDIWIIERWSGLAVLGIFSCAVGLAQYLTIVPIALNTVLMPYMSRVGREEAYAKLQRYSRVTATFLFFPVLIFAIFPEKILFLIFGSAFISGAAALRILALAYWCTSLKHVFIFFNASQSRLRMNLYVECLGLILGVFLNFHWIPIYGIEGAASAFLATGAATLILSFITVLYFSPTYRFNYFLITLSDIRTLASRLRFKSA